MTKVHKILLWSMSLFFFCAINLRAQESVGFIDSLSQIVVNHVQIKWQESKLRGEWHNLSFTDSSRFVYRLQNYRESYKPLQVEPTSNDGAKAAMGDFSTSHWGPKYLLLGYILEDSIWCILPATLSPEYVTPTSNNQCVVYEAWNDWRELRVNSEADKARYKLEETSVNHGLTILGRLPLNKTVQVWWGADAFACWDVAEHSDIHTATNIAVLAPVVGQPARWFDSLDEYMNSGSGLWNLIGEFNVEYPLPPPAKNSSEWAKSTFVERLNRDGSNADGWLPEPGAEIGLLFKFERPTKRATVAVHYNIFNISKWQGECMNYPANAPRPRATSTDNYFDFSVVDTAKYVLALHDYELVAGFERRASSGLSICRYDVSANLRFPAGETTIYDTLWLKALDYGANAMVSASTGQDQKRLMQPHTTAFGQQVWAVSVPRDDDGQAVIGYNYGDFMADAWEEAVLGLSAMSDSTAVLDFTPFYTKDTSGHRVYADQDNFPEGRGINGDGFCNWEEYRGIITVGDQYGFYPSCNPHQHKRLNPSKKELMVHFIANAECLSEAPGWMSALPDTMAYLVEHLTSSENSDSVRLYSQARVNINKYGALYPYTSRKASFSNDWKWSATEVPAADGYQNAIVFGAQYRGNEGWLTLCEQSIGYVKAYPSKGNSWHIPNNVQQAIIRTDFIENIRGDLLYYSGSAKDSVWSTDKTKLIQLNLAHQTGHAIGMTHDPFYLLRQSIMGESLLINPDNGGKLYLDPPTFPRQYSDSSKAKISIQMRDSH